MCCASFVLAIISIMRGDHKDETKRHYKDVTKTIHTHTTDMLYFGYALVVGNILFCVLVL